MAPENRHETAMQIVQAAPSVAAVVATKVIDIPIDTLLGLVGIAFIVLQAAYLIWRWRRDVRRDAKRNLWDYDE